MMSDDGCPHCFHPRHWGKCPFCDCKVIEAEDVYASLSQAVGGIVKPKKKPQKGRGVKYKRPTW